MRFIRLVYNKMRYDYSKAGRFACRPGMV